MYLIVQVRDKHTQVCKPRTFETHNCYTQLHVQLHVKPHINARMPFAHFSLLFIAIGLPRRVLRVNCKKPLGE